MQLSVHTHTETHVQVHVKLVESDKVYRSYQCQSPGRDTVLHLGEMLAQGK